MRNNHSRSKFYHLGLSISLASLLLVPAGLTDTSARKSHSPVERADVVTSARSAPVAPSPLVVSPVGAPGKASAEPSPRPGAAAVSAKPAGAMILVTDPTQKPPQQVGGSGCSLVEAIYSANFNDNKAIDSTNPDHFITTDCVKGTGNDTIVLPAGAVFQMGSIIGDAHNPFGPTATPIIFSNIIIEANGSRLERTGNLNARAFSVGTASVDTNPGGTPNVVSGTGNLTIRNAHIKGFNTKGGFGGLEGGGGGMGAGGAIYLQEGTLTVENSTFEGNSAIGGNGGNFQGLGGHGGGGGLSGNGGGGEPLKGGGGGGGSRGEGGRSSNLGGGGGGGTVTGGGNSTSILGGAGGFKCGGAGGDFGNNGADGSCPGGGGGGGSPQKGSEGLHSGGKGNYGGGGGGGSDDGGNGGGGGFGGGGGAARGVGASGGFGGGGGAGFTGGGGGTGSGAFGGNGGTFTGGGGAGLGGAIFNDSGTVIIRNSTFTANSVTGGQAGGTFITGGTLGIVGADAGGAIFSRNGSLTVLNSTISGNQSSGTDAGIFVFEDASATSFTLRNTIIANNGADECHFVGNVTHVGSGNLIVNNLGCPGMVSMADPQLAPLQFNAPGNTPTMAITTSSPAFDAGDDNNCQPTDQRGVPRPQFMHCDIGAYEVACSTITCPDSVTQSNDPDKCGAVVSFPVPTTNGPCTPVCLPASGSLFPVGTTTVTCMADSLSCSFTVTVNDTQKPTITCAANVTAVTDQNACPNPTCQVVSYPPPVASDNCPGVTAVCNPPSGSCFPTGVTTVTCTATDTSGNTAACSFTVATFDVALQDDSDPSTILLWNSITGSYRFCCKGITFTGIGNATIKGCVYTLQHNPADRRVLGRVDKAVHAGSASIQAPAGTIRCTITDRNTANDTFACS